MIQQATQTFVYILQSNSTNKTFIYILQSISTNKTFVYILQSNLTNEIGLGKVFLLLFTFATIHNDDNIIVLYMSIYKMFCCSYIEEFIWFVYFVFWDMVI